MNREEKITEAVTNDGFIFKGVHYKPVTTRMLMLLEKFKSPYYVGGDQLKGLMDLLFICTSDLKAIQRYTSEEFDDAVYEFADRFTAEDLAALGQITKEREKVDTATIVEVRATDSKKKAKAE